MKEGKTRRPAWQDPGTWAVLVLAVLAVAYFAWQAMGGSHTTQRELVGSAFAGPFAPAAGFLAFRVALRARSGRRVRLGWLLLGLAFLSFWLGEILEFVALLGGRSAVSPSWADIGFLGFFPLLLAGLLLFAKSPRSGSESFRFALDDGVLFSGGFLLIWLVALAPALQNEGGLRSAITVTYPMGGLLLLAGLSALAVRRHRLSSLRVLAALLVGVCLGFLSDLFYGYLSTHGGYISGGLVSGGYLASWFFLALAAQLEWLATGKVRSASVGIEVSAEAAITDATTAGAAATEAATRDAHGRDRLRIFPYVSIAVGLGVVVYAFREHFAMPGGEVASIAVLVTVFAIVRQVLAQRETSRLREERAARQELERFQEALERTQFLVDHADESIIWWDSEGRLLDANEYTCRTLEYSRDELRALTISDINPDLPRGASKWSEHWQELKERGSITMERRRRTKSGRIFPVEITANFMEYNGKEYNCSFTRDITDRKLAQETLRQSEERLRRAQAVAHLGNWELDLASMVVWSSDEALRICGLEGESPFQPIERLGQLTVPEDRAAADESLEAAVRGEPFDRLHRIKRENDGEERIVHSWAELIRDDQGLPVKVAGVLQDVTDWRLAQEKLRLAQFSLDHTSDFVWWLDQSGAVINVSDSACRRLGYSREELLSLTVFDITVGLDPQSWPERWETVKQAGNLVFEKEYRAKDGELVPVEISANYIAFEGQEYNCAFARDISERKLAEETLRQSEERLRRAQAVAHLGNWELELATGMMWSSNEGLQISGIEDEGPHQPVERMLQLTVREDRPRLAESMRALVEERASFDLLHRIKRENDGEERIVHSWAELIRDDQGVPVKVAGIIQDVTERQLAEEALQEAEAQLRQAQKMEAVGQLAGGIAHDFNNLLTAISGYSDLILNSDENVSSQVRDDVMEIKVAAGRAADLTRQILAFSRRQALRPEVVSLNEIVSGTERLLSRTLGEDIDLITVLAPDLGLTEVDRSQMENVIMNLALNARDAMPEGGELTLETANAVLSKEYCRRHPETSPGRYVTLTVSDSGMGIDEQAMSRIFEPFFTTKEQGKGTGLGLATVYGVVKQSGGNIVATSAPGKGARFHIFLPLVDRARRQPAGTSEDDQVMGGGESILVVEDEPAVRRLVGNVLQRCGFVVQTVGSGDEALALLEGDGDGLDLLLTDIVLPGSLQGHQLAEKALELHPSLLVLYMSGYAGDAAMCGSGLGGAINYIQKPFASEALVRRLREVLDS